MAMRRLLESVTLFNKNCTFVIILQLPEFLTVSQKSLLPVGFVSGEKKHEKLLEEMRCGGSTPQLACRIRAQWDPTADQEPTGLCRGNVNWILHPATAEYSTF